MVLFKKKKVLCAYLKDIFTNM